MQQEKPKNKTINPYIMEIIIQRDIREMLPVRRLMSHDMLEAYIELAALYSREYWLILQEEYLRRMEYEISIY